MPFRSTTRAQDQARPPRARVAVASRRRSPGSTDRCDLGRYGRSRAAGRRLRQRGCTRRPSRAQRRARLGHRSVAPHPRAQPKAVSGRSVTWAIMADTMPADEQVKPVEHAAARLERGPGDPSGPHGRGLRGAVRRGVLRAMGPFTHYQRELDVEIVAGLRQQQARLDQLRAELDHLRERHSEQIDRLEDLTRELIRTAESLRQANVAAARKADDPTPDAGEFSGVRRSATASSGPREGLG